MASPLEFFEGTAKALKNNVFWGLPPPDLCGWPRCHLHRPTVPTAASEPWLSDNMYDIVVSECQRSGGAGSSTSSYGRGRGWKPRLHERGECAAVKI